MADYYVYIMSSKAKVLYIGMTNNVARRMYEHKNKMKRGFTAKYNVDNLVYFEEVETELAARKKEKRLKGWLREKKRKLIETTNPQWKDSAAPFLDDIMGTPI
jgi:putative endonuclease